ncbi:uncharacterized protein PHACADRAFT_93700 [Phanerochaete carnosa HHB-10118-sp]|uniref:Uncharacterized protein n=1 Tax=Phanerochaete carnosa (strain HHB-10118-sp) TaxID=650164 RepID=K5V0Y7_PHACS|nr:uncharacterized protein PHACADRAFT_93700 [Phanerochaete carnosa HHB-10118-sp]EKM56146.1 hypothetical protein PHACADRAFT_93700 [Phanerochaete carnosa HHB-10118-sp]
MFFITSFILALAATTAVSMPAPKDRRDVRMARRSAGGAPIITTTTAGAQLNASTVPFTSVTGSFAIPTFAVPAAEYPSTAGDDPSDLYIASLLVDLGSDFCENGIMVGINMGIDNGSQFINAFWTSFPDDNSQIFPNVSFAQGDNITVSISMTNATSSTAVVTNESTDESSTVAIETGPICSQAEVGWSVGAELNDSNDIIPFVDFGTVNITASAETSSGPVDISNATILTTVQNGTTVASALLEGEIVTIAFV